ncbi:MAG: hypothetical protein OHK0052_17960 [Anaerolineales bacterium]
MKTVILNGAATNDPLTQRIETSLLAQLHSQNYTTQTFTLRDHKIGNCAGDFYCWVRSPGQCNIADDNRAIAAAIATADLLVYLTPITFGGYSATLKKAVDHQIQNIAPFFITLNGETHHAKRYRRYADFLAIGWQPQPNPAAENIFKNLIHRNSLNFYAQASHCEILTGDPETATLASQIESALAAIARRESAPMCALPTPQLRAAHSSPPRRALLLVGSPRTRTNTFTVPPTRRQNDSHHPD